MPSASRRSLAGAILAAAVLAVPAVPALPPGAAASSQTDAPLAKDQLAARAGAVDALEVLYPDGLRFDVIRQGHVVGTHRATFSRRDGALVVESRMALDVTLLGLSVYTFDYDSTVTWQDRTPVSVQARTDDDGDVRSVSARWDGATLVVDGPDGRHTAEQPVFPTNHWNPAVLTEDRVLNTITGGLADVTITAGPVQSVETGTGPRRARRFDYTGDLRVSAWYDARGRWVKLRFEGSDGNPVTYVCRECGGDQTARTR